MNIIFGTDGWRGLLDSEVNEETVALVAQAFADYCNIKFVNPKVAIAFDGRRNSNEFASLFAKVLSGNSINVILSNNIIPTPVLSYTVKNNNLDAGVMITASHNPGKYNGIKFKGSYGGPFLTEATYKVEKLIGKSEIKKSELYIVTTDLIPNYIKQLNKLVDFKLIADSGLNILVDSMAGAGQTLIQEILAISGCKASTIYGEAKIDFDGRLAEPIEKNLTFLSDILKNDDSYSFGLATDGDADRLGVILDNGEWLSAQETILLLADFITNIKGQNGDLVKTSSVTDIFSTYFKSPTRHVHDVQVGFKYICEKMIETNIAFGAEESGGYGYGKHIPERDGILSALYMLEMLAFSGFKKLSEYRNKKRKEFGVVFYDRIDFEYLNNDRIDKLPNLFINQPKQIADINIQKTETFLSSRGIINGLKFILEGTQRWVLMRSSETEPLVRIYAEGQSAEEVKLFLTFCKYLIIQGERND